jgi:hypothetical protein
MATRKSAEAPERARTGRPPKYREEFVDQARKFCMLGATNDDLARLFEVGLSTLNRWIAEIPAFRDAIKAGREIADAEVASKLFHRACGYSHPAVKIMQSDGIPVVVDYTEHYPPDATSMIFWLKNRRPDLWRDKPSATDGDDVPTPVSVTVNVRDARVRDDDDSIAERPAG